MTKRSCSVQGFVTEIAILAKGIGRRTNSTSWPGLGMTFPSHVDGAGMWAMTLISISISGTASDLTPMSVQSGACFGKTRRVVRTMAFCATMSCGTV